MDLFVFVFFNGERVHSWLNCPSNSVAFVAAHRRRDEGKWHNCVPSREGSWRVTVALFNEHMEDTTSDPKSSEFSRSSILI